MDRVIGPGLRGGRELPQRQEAPEPGRRAGRRLTATLTGVCLKGRRLTGFRRDRHLGSLVIAGRPPLAVTLMEPGRRSERSADSRRDRSWTRNAQGQVVEPARSGRDVIHPWSEALDCGQSGGPSPQGCAVRPPVGSSLVPLCCLIATSPHLDDLFTACAACRGGTPMSSRTTFSLLLFTMALRSLRDEPARSSFWCCARGRVPGAQRLPAGIHRLPRDRRCGAGRRGQR